MNKEAFDKAVEQAFQWAWEDFCFKPMDFYASETGRERFREYCERAARAALDAAKIEIE